LQNGFRRFPVFERKHNAAERNPRARDVVPAVALLYLVLHDLPCFI
jgi:hypothetical protein